MDMQIMTVEPVVLTEWPAVELHLENLMARADR